MGAKLYVHLYWKEFHLVVFLYEHDILYPEPFNNITNEIFSWSNALFD